MDEVKVKELVTEEPFQTVISSKKKWLDFNLKEVWNYRDMIFLLVKRTFVSQYKQTILGPLWAIIQPLMTTVVFTIVFGNLAKLSTDGIPPFLFYMAGNIMWSYFAASFTGNAGTFTGNAGIMGKVYFPRIVMPISTIFSQMISFAIQFIFFVGFLIYFLVKGNTEIAPNTMMLLTPLLILQMALLALGFGIIISSLTTKYRDLSMLIGFGTQLWMYATPIAYSIDYIPQKYMDLYMLNPVTPIITTFRYAFLGSGSFDLGYYLKSWVVTLIILVIGILLFNRVEKTFMDTV